MSTKSPSPSSLKILLEDGRSFFGGGAFFCPEKSLCGELVFTTGMSGYVETLTDPSYSGQILVFTYPLIGNYGVPEHVYWEAKRSYLHGVVIGQEALQPSHAKATQSLSSFLKEQGIPLITQVDTRALTKHLRTQGSTLGVICGKDEKKKEFKHPHLDHQVKRVSDSEVRVYGRGRKRVFLLDCGMKESILQHLLHYPLEIVRVPFDYDLSKEKQMDGLVLSNGPGDPTKCIETIETIQKVLSSKPKLPIFGICLGCQLLALAEGAKTYKLKFGHRGQNQACLDKERSLCVLTSQNHGYAIERKSLAKDWEVHFENLHDGSVEGIRHKTSPWSAVQFHPESSPGPKDTAYLFEQFFRTL